MAHFTLSRSSAPRHDRARRASFRSPPASPRRQALLARYTGTRTVPPSALTAQWTRLPRAGSVGSSGRPRRHGRAIRRGGAARKAVLTWIGTTPRCRGRSVASLDCRAVAKCESAARQGPPHRHRALWHANDCSTGRAAELTPPPGGPRAATGRHSPRPTRRLPAGHRAGSSVPVVFTRRRQAPAYAGTARRHWWRRRHRRWLAEPERASSGPNDAAGLASPVRSAIAWAGNGALAQLPASSLSRPKSHLFC